MLNDLVFIYIVTGVIIINQKEGKEPLGITTYKPVINSLPTPNQLLPR